MNTMLSRLEASAPMLTGRPPLQDWLALAAPGQPRMPGPINGAPTAPPCAPIVRQMAGKGAHVPAVGRSRGGATTKIHALTDGYGRAVAFILSPGPPAVIPSTRSRKAPIAYDADACRQPNMIERAFCRLKDWRRIATRDHKLASNFASAGAIAAVIIWSV